MTQLKQHATAADIEAFERLLRESLSDDGAPRARVGERAPTREAASQGVAPPAHSLPPHAAQPASSPTSSSEAGIEDPLVLFAAELRGLSAPGEGRARADDWAGISGVNGAADPLADADADAVRAAAQYDARPEAFGTGPALGRAQAGFATSGQSDDDILREMLAPAGVERDLPAAGHRPRRIFYGLAGAAAVAVAAITFGFGWRKPVTDSAGTGGIPVIVAESGPTKERPADPGGVEQPNQDARVLSRPKAGVVEPSAVSSREEQPVDLAATLRQNEQQGGVPISEPRKVTSVPIRLEPQADGAGATRPVRDVAVQPQPAPVTTETLALAPTRAAALPKTESAPTVPEIATTGARPEPAPAPVVRSVAPITAGAGGSAAPARPESARIETPKVETPKIETPRFDAPRFETPKIDTRPVTTPLAIPARPVETPARPEPARTTPASRPGPPKVAAVAPPKEQKKLPPAPAAEATDESAPPNGGPLSLQPQPRTRPGQQTAARSEAPAESGGSGFAVQLSASPSRDEAQKSASALGSRFAGALSGAAPRVVTGEAKGQSVYRVRVTGLSREGAVSLCERIKSAGGTCFIARN